jgi:hypothetical protein
MVVNLKNVSMRDISDILKDEYKSKIFEDSLQILHSSQELKNKYDTSNTVCYFNTPHLEKSGVLKCVDKSQYLNGQRVKMNYKRLKRPYIYYENGKITVHLNSTNVSIITKNKIWNLLESMKSIIYEVDDL